MTYGIKEHNFKYKAFIVLQCLIWGFGNPITRYVYVSMTPFCYMAVRFGIATVIFAILFRRQIREDLEWEKIRSCLIPAVFMAATYILANLAISKAMVTIVGFLMGIPVIFTVLISIIFLKKSVKPSFIVAVVLVVAGMYMLCSGGVGSFSFGSGEIMALACSLSMALTLIASAKFIKDVGPVTLSVVQCAVTTVACTVFGIIFEDFSCMLTHDVIAWTCLLYISLGCTVAAFLLQNVSISHISAMFVSLAMCLEPLFTAVFSYFFLGERIAFIGIVGSIMIIAGVVIASLFSENEETASA